MIHPQTLKESAAGDNTDYQLQSAKQYFVSDLRYLPFMLSEVKRVQFQTLFNGWLCENPQLK